MVMSFLSASKRLLTQRRNLPPAAVAALSITPTTATSSFTPTNNIARAAFHISAPLQRRGGKKERNPKISITLEQLRMAARGRGSRLPPCHAEQEKVMNALEAAKYENWAIYKYVKEFDNCMEDYRLNHKGKDKIMMRELNKYVVRGRKQA